MCSIWNQDYAGNECDQHATSCNSRDKINLPFIVKVVSQSIIIMIDKWFCEWKTCRPLFNFPRISSSRLISSYIFCLYLTIIVRLLTCFKHCNLGGYNSLLKFDHMWHLSSYLSIYQFFFFGVSIINKKYPFANCDARYYLIKSERIAQYLFIYLLL